MDHDVFAQAQKYANERYPLPQDTPTGAATRTALLSFMLVLFFAQVEHSLGFPAALLAATAVAGGSVYFDTNQRYKNHSRAFKEAVERLEWHKSH